MQTDAVYVVFLVVACLIFVWSVGWFQGSEQINPDDLSELSQCGFDINQKKEQ